MFFGWRPHAQRWAFPNPVWSELRQSFQEGTDDLESTGSKCPVFGEVQSDRVGLDWPG